MKSITTYEEGTTITKESFEKEKAMIIREKNGYCLWICERYAAICQCGQSPIFELYNEAQLRYDWNTKTGDLLEIAISE